MRQRHGDVELDDATDCSGQIIARSIYQALNSGVFVGGDLTVAVLTHGDPDFDAWHGFPTLSARALVSITPIWRRIRRPSELVKIKAGGAWCAAEPIALPTSRSGRPSYF